MSLLRTFIAIEIPSEIQNAIHQNTAGLRQTLDRSLVRWVPVQNIHMTLKFLGNVSAANLETLDRMLITEASLHQPFTIQVGGLGVFPSPRRPRVIWIGIEAPETLTSLQHSIESAAARIGYEAESRPFSAHLTIGRVNQRAPGAELQRVRTAIEDTQIPSLGTVKVDAVYIFRSDLKPSGAVYTRLYEAHLGQNT
ncbi:MAG: RNA 2',3'-cyclic phosphodiesterase [Chloroflexi bacterium]|nr:RNA 2',3'-cyclic phosphodiesterase [Chloroflexota bacterium]